MDSLKVIKIGGQVLDDEEMLRDVLRRFASLPGKKILVHGGGKHASRMAERLGLKIRLVNGRRVTDAATLQVAQMVYAGLLNTNIVAQLQALQVNALGLTGADGNAIRSVKRPVGEVDFGFVGDVVAVNVAFLQTLLAQNWVPVFCALTHDGHGQILNTNADTIVSELAVALSQRFETELVFTFEKNGVLSDVSDEHSRIPKLTFEQYETLKSNGAFTDGMLPKLENAFRSLRKGVRRVRILHALDLGSLNAEPHPGTILSME